jgi:hypothetical protein
MIVYVFQYSILRYASLDAIAYALGTRNAGMHSLLMLCSVTCSKAARRTRNALGQRCEPTQHHRPERD